MRRAWSSVFVPDIPVRHKMTELESIELLNSIESDSITWLGRVSDTPHAAEVESCKDYFWCLCGKSEKQLVCDSFHDGSSFTSAKFTATESKKVFFYSCKVTVSLCVIAVRKRPTLIKPKFACLYFVLTF